MIVLLENFGALLIVFLSCVAAWAHFLAARQIHRQGGQTRRVGLRIMVVGILVYSIFIWGSVALGLIPSPLSPGVNRPVVILLVAALAWLGIEDNERE